MFEVLRQMFSYGFILRAFWVGILVSLCSSLLGVSLVLRRYSMLGEALSRVGFGSLACATALNIMPLAVSIPLVILASIFLLLRDTEKSNIKGDAATALVSTGSLALGVIVISLTTGLNTDVCAYMFGNILAVSKHDVLISLCICIIVIVLYIIFYNKIFAITFDESFARATGIKVRVYKTILSILTAVTIVLGMKLVGALLISSLIVFPALTSMRICKTFKTVTLSASVISVLCFFFGIVSSYACKIPTGASVVAVNLLLFLISCFKRKLG